MSVIVEHLNKHIGKQHVLQDVSLQIGEGEVVGLLGPNGAGKSTLMKILTGLWSFDSGRVEVCGVDMSRNPHDVAAFVGYLPENNPLYEEMYVREYLQFMCELSGKDYHRMETLIDETGIRPEISKKIGQLSKGYRQRVGLAQALLSNPQLLILDEPTTGLDPNQLEEIRTLIRNAAQGRTILLSTHIMQEVHAMCSRVLILNHGEIQLDTPCDANTDLEQLFKDHTR